MLIALLTKVDASMVTSNADVDDTVAMSIVPVPPLVASAPEYKNPAELIVAEPLFAIGIIIPLFAVLS